MENVNRQNLVEEVCKPSKNCINCGYRLNEIESGRCPECGRSLDLSDPSRFLVGEPRGRSFRSGQTFFVLAIVGSILATLPLFTFDVVGTQIGKTIQERSFFGGVMTEIGVLVVGVVAISLARWRFGAPFRAGMWVAGLTLGRLLYLLHINVFDVVIEEWCRERRPLTVRGSNEVG